jgi:IclR family pca regulon transcriptional regulator
MTQEVESNDTAVDRDHVGSLAKGLQVVEILAQYPAGMTLTEMSERAGLTRAGARRLLLTLVSSGYATQDGRQFRLTPRLLTLSRTWISGSSLWSFAEPFMRQLSEQLNESCSSAILADEDVVYVARVAGRRILSVALHVGTRLPALSTAMGRMLLSGLSPAELKAFLARAKIHANTPKSIIDRNELERIIIEAGQRGYATMDEELELGLRSIAVPIRDRDGRIVAAINISAQSVRFSIEEMEREILPHLKETAATIENYYVVH